MIKFKCLKKLAGNQTDGCMEKEDEIRGRAIRRILEESGRNSEWDLQKSDFQKSMGTVGSDFIVVRARNDKITQLCGFATS